MYITEKEIGICLDTMLKVVMWGSKLGYTEEEMKNLLDAHETFIKALRLYYDTITLKQVNQN